MEKKKTKEKFKRKIRLKKKKAEKKKERKKKETIRRKDESWEGVGMNGDAQFDGGSRRSMKMGRWWRAGYWWLSVVIERSRV